MILSRNYQVDELMRGIQRPLPALQRRPLRVIAEFLVEAWNGLLETQGQVLRTNEEKEVNTLMDSRLNCLFEQTPEFKMLITGVSRGRESINHDGSKLEKRPDFSIHLSNRSYRLPLIVECKLVDARNGKGIDLYCRQGLARFIDGEYAWYAQEAFMLAYVRDSATIATDLKPHLARHQKSKPDPFLTEQLPLQVNFPTQGLGQSRHGRQFPDSPGPITIWHLWVT
jgi:hypothetical protein